MLLFLLYWRSFLEKRYPPDKGITLNDIAFAVWTGKECINTRIKSIANAWLSLCPHAYIYTDYVNKSLVDDIIRQNNHVSLTFIEQGLVADYLVGSSYENPYNSAQSRHLQSLIDLYKREPKKKWYFICDDDCYVFPQKLCKFLRQKPGYLFGCTYYFIDETYKFFPTDPTRTFYHGGPGILIRNSLMKILVKNLPNCANMYAAGKLGSDIRISACLGHIFGAKPWYERYVEYLPIEEFSSNIPETLLEYLGISDKVMTYHLIKPENTAKIWKSHSSIWSDQKNIYITDWSQYSLTSTNIPVGKEGYNMKFSFMYSFYYLQFYYIRPYYQYFYATSQPQPIFDMKDKKRTKPIKYVQEFDSNIYIEYICDDDMQENDFAVEGFPEPPKFGAKIYIKCPKPQKIPKRNIKPSNIITLDYDHK